MFYIRADGNAKIGIGHVMRCLSIAEALKERVNGYTPIFITADDSCRALIEDRGFSVIALDTDYQDMMSELPKLKGIFDGERGILLVDSYQADADYFAAVSKFAYTVCFEDIGVPYPVDLLINYNIYAPKLKDKYRLGGESLNTLLGAEYVPLRKAFWEESAYRVRDKVTDVMITAGGSDPYFAAAALADAFMAAERGICGDTCNERITWHIVSGPFNTFADKLKEKYEGFENVAVHEGLSCLKPLIKECDVILSASGSTVYEISAVGVPMIVFYFAENQRQGAQELEALTDIVNAGDFGKDGETVVQRAAEALKRCITDKNYRERLHNQERKLIDGKGAHRIAKVLEDVWNMQKKAGDD